MSRGAVKLKLEIGPGNIEVTRLPGGRLQFELELDDKPGLKTRFLIDDETALELSRTIRSVLKVHEQLPHDGDCACVECDCECHVDGETDDHREKSCPCHSCECACHFDDERGGPRVA